MFLLNDIQIKRSVITLNKEMHLLNTCEKVGYVNSNIWKEFSNFDLH